MHNQPSAANGDEERNTIFANSIQVEDFDIEADKSVLRDSLSHLKAAKNKNTSLDLKQYLEKIKTKTLTTSTLAPEDMRNSIQYNHNTSEQRQAFLREED